VNKPTDRDIALGSGSTSFEADCAIARHCSRLGYVLALTDVQRWNSGEHNAVVAWIRSELIADRPAFLDRFSITNQEDTHGQQEEEIDETKGTAEADTVHAGGTGGSAQRSDAPIHRQSGESRGGVPIGGALPSARSVGRNADARGDLRGAPGEAHPRNAGAVMAPKKKTEKTKKPKEGKSAAPKLDAAAAKERPDTKVEKFHARLRVVLSKEEVAEKADRMAHVIGERENLVAQAKAATAHLKAQIKEKDAEIGSLSAQIRDKAEYGEVECERRHMYRTGKIVEVRLDNDEVTFERAMTFSERQLELPKKEAAKAKKPEAENDAGEEAPDQPGSDEPPESGEQGEDQDENESDTEATGE
jgi:hypothetical protein